MGVRAPPPGSGASRAAEPLLRPQRCRGSAEVGCGAARGEPDSVYSRTHWAPRGNTQGLPPPGGGLPSTSSQAHSAQARVHLPPRAPSPPPPPPLGVAGIRHAPPLPSPPRSCPGNQGRARPLLPRGSCPASGGEQEGSAVGRLAMASLRNASPKLRSYFKENYIPQVCEVLEPLGRGVRRRRNRKGFPRGGGRTWRGGVEEGKEEWERVVSALEQWAVSAEGTERTEG